MSHVFYHDQDNSRTFVIDMPSKETLLTLNAINNRAIDLKFGVTFKHPKDKFYVKAIGREKAVEAIELAPAVLVARQDSGDEVRFTLAMDGFLIYIKLTVRISTPIISYIQDDYND